MASANGTTVTTEVGPDPRFGMQAPVMKSVKVETPQGLTSEVTTERLVELTDPNNPLSLKTWTEKMTTKVMIEGSLKNRTTTLVYDAPTRKMTTTSPELRTREEELDVKGRVIKVRVPGLAEVTYQYDTRGRLSQTTATASDGQTRIGKIDYYADPLSPQKGYVEKLTDALNHEDRFTYDAVGRVVGLDYDANGNLTKVVPPGKPEHFFAYNEVDA